MEKQSELHARLAPVVKRQRTQALLRQVALGTTLGAAAATAVAMLRWWLPLPLVAALACAVVLAGGAVGAWLAARRRSDWHAAAAAVDAHYGLRDRTLTAVSFAEQAAGSPLHQAQIADALARLDRIDPKQVVKMGPPRALPAALVLVAMAAGAVAWPIPRQPAKPEATDAQAAPSVMQAPPAVPVPATSAPTAKPPGILRPADPAAAARLRAEIGWRPADDGATLPGRAKTLAGPTLEQLAADLASTATAQGTTAEATQPPPAILPDSEPLAPEYRQTVRRYFDSIRPDAAADINTRE